MLLPEYTAILDDGAYTAKLTKDKMPEKYATYLSLRQFFHDTGDYGDVFLGVVCLIHK